MAKKTKKKQKGKKTGPVRKSSPFTHVSVWFVLVLVIVLGVVAYQKIYVPEQEKKQRIATEEKQFAEGQRAIDTLAGKVATQFPPTSRESKNSCDYGSREFDLGPLSCTIEINLIYKNVDVETANKIMIGANQLNGDKALKNGSSNQSAQLAFDGKNNGSADNFYANLNLDDNFCNMSLYFPATAFKLSDADLLVSITCSQPATKEFYPVDSKNY